MQNSWPLSFMKKRATGPATDPYFANTVLLAGPSGSNGATSFNDESAAAHGSITSPGINNDAVVSNAQTLFGSNTMFFDSGLNDNFQLADHADWTGGTQLRTIEGFIRLNAASTDLTFIGQYNATGSQRGWQIQYQGSLGTPVLRFIGSTAGTDAVVVVSGAVTFSTATWYYFCYERAASNVHRVYAGPLGGTASMLAKATDSINIFNSTAPLIMCGTFNVVGNFNGNMGEVRITNGVARYDTDAGFPVPDAKFPRS